MLIALTATVAPTPTSVPADAGGGIASLIFAMVVTAVLAYMLGGVNGAIIASKYIFNSDIRKSGSGNPGLTNAYRVFGIKGAAVTFIIDTAKAAVAVLIGWLWVGNLIVGMFPAAEDANVISGLLVIGKMYAGLFAMFGHAFPAWYGFKGGRGVLVCGVMALMIHPLVGLCCWAVFIAVVAVLKYVSIGSIIAGIIAFPLFTGLFVKQNIATGLAVTCGVLIVLMHAANIDRLIHGKEPKFGQKKAQR